MKRPLLALLAAGAIIATVLPAAVSAAGPRMDLRVGPMLGAVHARGAAGPFGGGGSNPNMTYHNGPLMTSGAAVTQIFWGPSWSSTTYRGDVVNGLSLLYSSFGGSGYMRTNIEYKNTAGAFVSSAVTLDGTLTDTSATPRRAPKTADVLAIVAKNITTPKANGYYPVYTDIKRGSAGYCAWHSWGTVNGVMVKFAFFFDLTGDSGCDPKNPDAKWSQNMEALASVTGHELSEAVTDPEGTGWFDGSGAENADKCAWKFDQTVSLGGTSWWIQGNWSNAAYTAGTGLPNSSGQKGCLYNS